MMTNRFRFLPFKGMLSTLAAVLSAAALFAQMPVNGLDVRHYTFNISLNDSNEMIHCQAGITTSFTKAEKEVWFDLVKKDKEGKGMTVTAVTKNGRPVNFRQDSQHLILEDQAGARQENHYLIRYEGIPADGLIISRNKYGRRVFFADNWPNRAHNWIPCNDHLSDKATVDFIVTAPDHYQVVSNGVKVEETNLPHHVKLTHWKEDIPLPTKIMVIGVADFAVNTLGGGDCIPVSSWVYPEDRDSGFAHYAVAKDILQWYRKLIGPYPFEKLANVQSKTIFGGMENAGCIFYFENSVDSKGIESLMAHEIAHQWFGDHVTEKDWPHLWLSEGFATYLTDLYLEDKYGRDSLQRILRDQREQVLQYDVRHKTPVVDTSESRHLMNLLNANSYQKGAWVLHMLRRKIGDSLFLKAIRVYYKTYAGSNANTADLEKVVEKVSHQNLATFFNQWLFTPGQPVLQVAWNYNRAKKSVLLTITQAQSTLFTFPLQVRFTNGQKNSLKTIDIKNRITKKMIPLDFEPVHTDLDPNVNLLFRSF